jgi:LPXTG-motif cell wall-anchored protein
MVEAQVLLDWALNGKDGSNAPVIDGGGAKTAYQHGQLMAGYSPVFSTTAPDGIVVAAPATGEAAIPLIGQIGLATALVLLSIGALVLARRRVVVRRSSRAL